MSRPPYIAERPPRLRGSAPLRTYFPYSGASGTIARRLLWTVDGEACGFADGEFRTLAGASVAGGTTVELWHPIT